MIWQDLAFATGSGFFVASLLPLIRSRDASVPRLTSVPTAFFIAVFAVAHASIGFYWAASTEALGSIAWWWIAWRKATNARA